VGGENVRPFRRMLACCLAFLTVVVGLAAAAAAGRWVDGAEAYGARAAAWPPTAALSADAAAAVALAVLAVGLGFFVPLAELSRLHLRLWLGGVTTYEHFVPNGGRWGERLTRDERRAAWGLVGRGGGGGGGGGATPKVARPRSNRVAPTHEPVQPVVDDIEDPTRRDESAPPATPSAVHGVVVTAIPHHAVGFSEGD